MNVKELDNVLFRETENERYYKEGHPFSKRLYSDSVHKEYIEGREVLLLNVSDLNIYPIHVRKDSRYTFLPFHTYKHININYIYSGTCTYFIDNKEITLRQGELCIFDKNVVRAKMKPGKNDIIINIVMTDNFFKSVMNFGEQANILSNFMEKSLYSNESHDNYIIFKTHGKHKLHHIFQDLLIENYGDSSYKNVLLQHYFSIVMIELLKIHQASPYDIEIHFSDKQSNNLFSIVQYIEQNYQSCTLQELSLKFNYHEKYICSLLKRNYGKTFKQIQTDIRMLEAARLLIQTRLSVNEIAERVGLHNYTKFYKTFKAYYQTLPADYRKKAVGGNGENELPLNEKNNDF